MRFGDETERRHVVQHVHHVAAGRAVRVRAADDQVVDGEGLAAEVALQPVDDVALDGVRHHGAVGADEGDAGCGGRVFDDEGAGELPEMEAATALAHVSVAHLSGCVGVN